MRTILAAICVAACIVFSGTARAGNVYDLSLAQSGAGDIAATLNVTAATCDVPAGVDSIVRTGNQIVVSSSIGAHPPVCTPPGPYQLTASLGVLPDGSYDFMWTADSGSMVLAQGSFKVVLGVLNGVVSYEGLWLKGDESGWGLNVTHQGSSVFVTWFTYDTDGRGMWLVMSSRAQASTSSYTGTVYRTTGPPFTSISFTPIAFPDNYRQIGTLTLSFTDANTGIMTYTLNDVFQSKPIKRYIYASGGNSCVVGGTQGASPNYQDLWVNYPPGSEEGWGVNLVHQGEVLFATWFTYDADGKGLWLVMSNGARTSPGVYAGALQRTTGPAFSANPWNPSQVTRTTVGSATFTFVDANHGTFAYTVNGVSGLKALTRRSYDSPTTVCH